VRRIASPAIATITATKIYGELLKFGAGALNSGYLSRRHFPSFARSSGVPQRRQKLRHRPSTGSKKARLRDRRWPRIQQTI
jgi:hypothetical protein